MMNRSVMAVEASGVSRLHGKCTYRSQVASSAFFLQHRMRFAHAAAGIDAMIAIKAAPGNPNQRDQRKQEAKPELGTLQRRRPFEIIEVDALRKLFCCACACHVSLYPPYLAEQLHFLCRGAPNSKN